MSYISKWTSGQLLPSEKYEKKILRGISSCVVSECVETARDKLLADYQVENAEELKMAILITWKRNIIIQKTVRRMTEETRS